MEDLHFGQNMDNVLETVEQALKFEEEHAQTPLLLTEEVTVLEKQPKRHHAKSKSAQVK